jgi:hypothetical protein
MLLHQSVSQWRSLQAMSVVAFEGGRCRRLDVRLHGFAFDLWIVVQSTGPTEA